MELVFNPSRLGITKCQVIRLGGDIHYPEIDRIFIPQPLGVESHSS
jgi:hypothetical protein